MTIIQQATVCILVLNVIVLAIAGYLLFGPVKYTVIYNEPFPVTPGTVKRGEDLTYTIEYEKFKHYGVVTEQAMICADGNLVTLAPRTTNLPLGRHTVTHTVTVPNKASFTTCYIELKQTITINRIRVTHTVMRTQSFSIIP
jgi:hypothetical protein